LKMIRPRPVLCSTNGYTYTPCTLTILQPKNKVFATCRFHTLHCHPRTRFVLRPRKSCAISWLSTFLINLLLTSYMPHPRLHPYWYWSVSDNTWY
jgi:hypothetical protein